jgi:cell division protein FtsL
MRKELKLVARTRRVMRQSQQLIVQSEKLIAEWQNMIDEQTAKMLERISTRVKRKRRRGHDENGQTRSEKS